MAKITIGKLSPVCRNSGGYRVQPPAAAPPGTKNVDSSRVKANGRIQKLKLFMRGSAMSGRADLQRNHPIRESDERRHDGAEDHDQGMIGGHLIEEFRIDELQAGFEQFGPNDHGHCAADEEHDQAEHQVHGADVFVVGGEQPALDAGGRPVVVLVRAR